MYWYLQIWQKWGFSFLHSLSLPLSMGFKTEHSNVTLSRCWSTSREKWRRWFFIQTFARERSAGWINGTGWGEFLKLSLKNCNFLSKERLLGMGWVMCTTRRCSSSRRSSNWGSTSVPSASQTLPVTTMQRSALYLATARMGPGCIRQACIPLR